MSKEVELKFIVEECRLRDVLSNVVSTEHIKQGYLFESEHMRVRNVVYGINNKKSFITIKGDRREIERDEYEYEIPFEDGEEMMDKFATSFITKNRFNIIENNQNWSIDLFLEKHVGLNIAELEIENYNESMYGILLLPSWIDPNNEVSYDKEYYNYHLSKNPVNYLDWNK